MTKENITRITLEEALRNKGQGKTDWEALDREEAAGIEPIPDPDEGTFDWSRAYQCITLDSAGRFSC